MFYFFILFARTYTMLENLQEAADLVSCIESRHIYILLMEEEFVC